MYFVRYFQNQCFSPMAFSEKNVRVKLLFLRLYFSEHIYNKKSLREQLQFNALEYFLCGYVYVFTDESTSIDILKDNTEAFVGTVGPPAQIKISYFFLNIMFF